MLRPMGIDGDETMAMAFAEDCGGGELKTASKDLRLAWQELMSLESFVDGSQPDRLFPRVDVELGVIDVADAYDDQ